MPYRLVFANTAQKQLKAYKKSNPIAFKKIVKLMPELEQHPRTGTGHPEPLKNGGGITYSRRITASDRLIYDILDNIVQVTILSVEGHYNDK